MKPEPLLLSTKLESTLPKHEPISPVEETPLYPLSSALSSASTTTPLAAGYQSRVHNPAQSLSGMPTSTMGAAVTGPNCKHRDINSITSLPLSILRSRLRKGASSLSLLHHSSSSTKADKDDMVSLLLLAINPFPGCDHFETGYKCFSLFSCYRNARKLGQQTLCCLLSLAKESLL